MASPVVERFEVTLPVEGRVLRVQVVTRNNAAFIEHCRQNPACGAVPAGLNPVVPSPEPVLS